MRIWRNPLYNSLGGIRKHPQMRVPPSYSWGRLRCPPVFCPPQGREISFAYCLECPEYRVWHAKDGGFRRCRHEYADLASRGYYDGTWDDHPENFDPETFAEIQARKRINEEFLRDFEREKAEMERLAEALEQDEEAKEEPLDEEGQNEY